MSKQRFQMDDFGISDEYSCRGPSANFIKLITDDEHEFYVPRRLVHISPTILNMISGPDCVTIDEPNQVRIHGFASHVVQKVCHYFSYHARYTDRAEQVHEFEIKPEVLCELILCADYLKC